MIKSGLGDLWAILNNKKPRIFRGRLVHNL